MPMPPVLFPPCTMLHVKQKPKSEVIAAEVAQKLAANTGVKDSSLSTDAPAAAPETPSRRAAAPLGDVSKKDPNKDTPYARFCVEESELKGRKFLRIDVMPTFL